MELEFTFETLVSSAADPAGLHTLVKNPVHNKMVVVADAELDAISTSAWIMASSPMDCDTIIVTHLNGQEMPNLDSFIATDTLGMKFNMYGDAAVTVGDYKGLYKNPYTGS